VLVATTRSAAHDLETASRQEELHELWFGHIPHLLERRTMTGAEERAVLERLPSGLHIGGQWRAASGGGTLAVEDPSTGESLIEVADATPEDALAALGAAADAQAAWAATAPRERGEILRRAYELLLQRADELALVMTMEMGKALGESRAEITYAAEFLR
jgi:succinate-semialdehyde dehydrogenase / glutarate-semialdehyde dehydrogenase